MFLILEFIYSVVKLGFRMSQIEVIMTLVSGFPMGPPQPQLQKATKEFTNNVEAKQRV